MGKIFSVMINIFFLRVVINVESLTKNLKPSQSIGQGRLTKK